jgi:hypothetical protein
MRTTGLVLGEVEAEQEGEQVQLGGFEDFAVAGVAGVEPGQVGEVGLQLGGALLAWLGVYGGYYQLG